MFNIFCRKSILKVFILVLFILIGYSITTLNRVPALESAPLTSEPETMLDSDVKSYDLVDSRLLWHTEYFCINNSENPQNAHWDEAVTIKRVGTLGSLEKTLFSRDPDRAEGECNPYHIRSNIVSDGTYIFWADDDGLQRLSINANPSDSPVTIHTHVKSTGNDGKVELAVSEDRVYAVTYEEDGSSKIRQLIKHICPTICLGQTILNRPGHAHNLSHDGQYLYWVEEGALNRVIPGQAIKTIVPNDVTGYFAEGATIKCNGQFCLPRDSVFVGQGPNLLVYNNITESLGSPIYTAEYSEAFIYSVTLSGSDVLFFEARPFWAQLLVFYNQVLMRTDRAGTTNAECTYNKVADNPVTADAFDLKTEGEFVFWQEKNAVKRLPADAEACEPINVSIEQMMVTQAIQTDLNNVPLIEGKRTYVRVLAKTDGPTAEGVTAHLYRVNPLNNAIMDGPLIPINPSGPYQTLTSKTREDLADGDFLFLVPRDWVKDPTNHAQDHGLALKVIVNPYDVPIETDKSDNSETVEVSTWKSPRMGLHLYAFQYEDKDGNLVEPNIVNDVLLTYDSLKRVYPLDSTPSSSQNLLNPTVGLQAYLKPVKLNGLADRVTAEHPFCESYKNESDEGGFDRRYLCAINYANHYIAYLRNIQNIPEDTVTYGLIKSDLWNGGGKVTEIGGRVGTSYTELGTFKDTAAHEVGHAFGLMHPGTDKPDDPLTAENESCGHSPHDTDYPYPNAQIGLTGKMWGFDSGNFTTGLGKNRRILPAESTHSLMSYCTNRWISNYNYTKMWIELIQSNNSFRSAEVLEVMPVIGVYGSISTDSNEAFIEFVSISENVPSPKVEDHSYEIHLVDKDSALLASYGLKINEEEHHPVALFDQLVPYVDGTAALQIVDGETYKVLASYSISSNPPVLSNINIDYIENDGQPYYELSWKASDPDDDPLTFNLYYNRDESKTYEPLQLGLTEPTAQVDPAILPGGSISFKVVVSDGAHEAEAESETIKLLHKAPVPYILNPADGSTFQWGQLITLSGEAFDIQDGGVDWEKFEWSNQDGSLGVGGLLEVSDLPVGENTITLKVTNSHSLSAETSITIYIEDKLAQPGPIAAVGPESLNWQISKGTGYIQEVLDQIKESLTIYNLGSGELGNWTVDNPVEWLTVREPGFDETGDVVVVVNYTFIEPGEVVETNLTFTFEDLDPVQQVIVPVTVARGSFGPGFVPPELPPTEPPPTEPPPTSGHTIFLPIVVR